MSYIFEPGLPLVAPHISSGRPIGLHVAIMSLQAGQSLLGPKRTAGTRASEVACETGRQFINWEVRSNPSKRCVLRVA